MSTVVSGLIKIGKTGTNNFENRMYDLEHNGYANVTGLKRVYAIEVDDYDEKEYLLHTIFSKSRVADTELFAQDKHIVVELLSSFAGRQVYPIVESKPIKPAVLNDAQWEFELKVKALNNFVVHGYMNIPKDGEYVVLAGSVVSPLIRPYCAQALKDARKKARIDKQNMLLEDVAFTSASSAAGFVAGSSEDGPHVWKNKAGKRLEDILR